MIITKLDQIRKNVADPAARRPQAIVGCQLSVVIGQRKM
jgi:hypothetical protein